MLTTQATDTFCLMTTFVFYLNLKDRKMALSRSYSSEDNFSISAEKYLGKLLISRPKSTFYYKCIWLTDRNYYENCIVTWTVLKYQIYSLKYKSIEFIEL